MSGLWLTRGEYDAVVIGEAPDFETVAAIKMMVLASGAMNEMVILEAADFNAIGERAAAMMAGRVPTVREADRSDSFLKTSRPDRPADPVHASGDANFASPRAKHSSFPSRSVA